MRICVLQSAYDEVDHALKDLDNEICDPARFVDQHQFEHRFIHKKSAREQIDAAVAEKFDFYLNFMWGYQRDEVAGVEASRYFESLNLPSAGVRSWFLERSKADFYDDARRLGKPLVPGKSGFPLFVKPSFGYASLHIHEDSLCHNAEELDKAVARVQDALKQDAANGHTVGQSDVIVQDYIEGDEFLVTVLNMAGQPVALDPCKVRLPPSTPTDKQFQTMASKFDPKTALELLSRSDDAALFDKLQEAAVDAYLTLPLRNDNMGVDVDVRVSKKDGKCYALELNPMPAAFLPADSSFPDLPITQSLPGSYRALVNIFIANAYIADDNSSDQVRVHKVSHQYDDLAPRYDGIINNNPTYYNSIHELVSPFSFDGSILDVACGTGFLGKLLHSMGRTLKTPITGVDASEAMIELCKPTGFYGTLYHGFAQKVLPTLGSFDHVVALGVMYFFAPPVLSLVLARMFQMARRSVTFAVDEIPDIYNENCIKHGYPHMVGRNHVSEVEAFGVPLGWSLKAKIRKYCWESHFCPVGIHATFYHFERE